MKVLSDIGLVETEESVGNLRPNSQYHGRDFNRELPVYKSIIELPKLLVKITRRVVIKLSLLNGRVT
jgi:hypothetical protein